MMMKMKLAEIDEKSLKNYIIAVLKIKPMTPEKRILLAEKLKKSEKSDEKTKKILIENCLKMALSIAASYRGSGVTFAGLIRAANRGLIKGVYNWYKSKEENFENYTAWNIEGAIIRKLIRGRKIAGNKKR